MAKKGRPKVERLVKLDTQIEEALAADNPQSVRHVFYLMTDPTLPVSVDKTEHGYKLVQRRCVKLRRDGIVPYDWISDATRVGVRFRTRSASGSVGLAAYWHRVDPWNDADVLVSVWCESRSVAGTIRNTCDDLCVSLYPCGGFASLSLTADGARDIREDARGRPVVILYIGDYDPAGVLIPQSVMGELELHLPDFKLHQQRLAITSAQAEGLPSKPRKAGEKRVPEILQTVEVEAMPAGQLRDVLTQAVGKYLPTGALERAQEQEKDEKHWLTQIATVIQRQGVAGCAHALEAYDEGSFPRPRRD